jgi:hypothetical protein
MLPSVLAGAQRRNGAQVILTSHSPDLLADEGIRADEVLLLTPTSDGTIGATLNQFPDAMELMEAGLPLADVVRPRSEPPDIERLLAASVGES